MMLIFQFCFVNQIHGTVFTIERPARSLKIKASRLRKRGMEEIRRTRQKTVLSDWSHPSLCGEVTEVSFGPDEYNQTGILTSASSLTPAFPSLRTVALEVCSRYSGATVPDSHRVP
jgi:hypothetical protein